MTTLYGKKQNAASLAERAGSLTQFGGVRLVTFGDGVERGIRVLEFRTGSGLTFSVLVDRAMDISDLAHNGRAMGWHSPTGFRHPGLHEPEGEQGLGWTRSFSGFLSTCGLDHILGPEEVPAENYNYPRKATVKQSLHGRISGIPARLTGYGETWNGDRCVLWAEGVIIQAAVFGEVLQLHRRIEADLGGNEIRLTDRVVNAGFAVTPHMFFYHINMGYPLVDEGSRYLAPIKDVSWASHESGGLEKQGVGYRRCPSPINGFSEQVWEYDMGADAKGHTPVAVVNDALGIGMLIETQKSQLPCSYQWQNFQSGHYVMAVEPSTHHAKGNLFARGRDEMIWLKAGEQRTYDTRFMVLDGAADIKKAEQQIAAIARQPDTDYPKPSGKFVPLHGAAGKKP
ncbi:aldose 1-epimerase family protein [Aestuariivirga litoralis]|uniref:aldose 1-epimerase family protein n=1 Tax=Aestuariivirga litoralis TaxID=2650924 RepID=UPI0018C80B86|nr:aldose 1-epimerase family protein [Aestuariivirga litoralis]MBG1232357.1 aldose 1-epimerase family protein [Aestuariivirga litoralis]